MKLRFVTSWISLIAFVALGCAGPKPAYVGARRPPDQVALIEAGPKSRILAVDGRKYFDRQLELLPGERTVEFKFTVDAAELRPDVMLKKAKDRATFVCELKFVVEAGHSYRIERDKPDHLSTRVRGDDIIFTFDEFAARVTDLSTNQEIAVLQASPRPGPGKCPHTL